MNKRMRIVLAVEKETIKFNRAYKEATSHEEKRQLVKKYHEDVDKVRAAIKKEK